jgi:hypothetical protein
VKLKLGGTEYRTNTISNNKNPYWGGEDDHSRFRFEAPDPNAVMYITVGDWKIGKNSWIARLAIPLASIEATSEEEGQLKEFELRCRVSRFNKHIEKEGTSDSKLVLKLRYEHMERWWMLQVSTTCGWKMLSIDSSHPSLVHRSCELGIWRARLMMSKWYL